MLGLPRFVLLLLLACALALPAGAPSWAARLPEAPCPSRPAIAAVKACLDLGLAPSAPRSAAFRTGVCDLVAVDASAPALSFEREAFPFSFPVEAAKHTGIMPPAAERPPRSV